MNYHFACSNLAASEEEVGWRWEKVTWRRRRCSSRRCYGLRRLLLVLGGDSALSLYRHQPLFFSIVLFSFSLSFMSFVSVFSSLFLFFSMFLSFFFPSLFFFCLFLCLSLFSTILFLLPKSSPLSVHLKMLPPHYLSFVPLKTHHLFLQIFLPSLLDLLSGVFIEQGKRELPYLYPIMETGKDGWGGLCTVASAARMVWLPCPIFIMVASKGCGLC